MRTKATAERVLAQRREAAVYLLEKGARQDHENGEGYTPLTLACRDCEC